MITLQHISLRRGTKTLLEDSTFSIYAKQKIGLIGDNGCGKSSFFGMLLGEFEPHKGTLSFPAQLEVAHVSQEIPTTQKPAMEYVIDGDKRLRSIQANLKKAEDENDAHLIAKCHDELASIDGYTIVGRAEKILKGLGFPAQQLNNPVTAFSGGWRMRLNLAQALISQADLMLLDEPTNHLDINAVIWLEKWLQDYPGTLIVISHDREFLDNTVTHILHFDRNTMQLYRGNYSSFEDQLHSQLQVQQAAYEKQQTQIEHMQQFIDRFRAKATKARQAQSRLKALQRIDRIAAVTLKTAFTFKFKQPKACPNPLLKIEKAAVGYGDKTVLESVDLQLAPSDRIGLLGMNGAGKSTLIKLIAGILKEQSGLCVSYKGTKIGYFAQHQVEHLDLSLSPLELLQEIAPRSSEQELRSYLGSFNFGGKMATEKITAFSGGEKARVALALIVWEAPNLLLLDEPTNHLDMNMREALVFALQEYTGALILVSHDRHLLRTTTDELIIVADKKVLRYAGDLDDYKQLQLQKNNNPSQRIDSIATKHNPGKERRKLETKLNTLEKELSKLQAQKAKIELILADSYEQNPTTTISDYVQQQEKLQKDIQKLEEEWLLLTQQLENFS